MLFRSMPTKIRVLAVPLFGRNLPFWWFCCFRNGFQNPTFLGVLEQCYSCKFKSNVCHLWSTHVLFIMIFCWCIYNQQHRAGGSKEKWTSCWWHLSTPFVLFVGPTIHQHYQLCMQFSLCVRHGFKKYYIKIILGLLDMALTNASIHYSLTNPEKKNMPESMVDFTRRLKLSYKNRSSGQS